MPTSRQFGSEFSGAELDDWASSASIFIRYAKGRPANVFRRVVAVVIYPIQHAVGWAFSNICQKIRETIPARTDFDSTTTVVFVGFIVWVVAASAQATPNLIEWMYVFSTSVAVVSFFTPARTSVVVSKFVDSSEMFFAAVTAATPHNTSVETFGCWFNCNQSTETPTRDINGFGHGGLPIGCCGKWRGGVSALPRCA